jgi:hypothetical protein
LLQIFRDFINIGFAAEVMPELVLRFVNLVDEAMYPTANPDSTLSIFAD